MPFSRKRLTLTTAAILGIVVAGCTESKTAQCNKLIEVANKAVSDVQTITTTAKPDDISAMTRIAETADAAKQSMQALELSDTSLQGFQQQFVTMYTATSEATRDLVAAVEAKNSEQAETAYQALQAATEQEAPLVTEVNNFCAGTAPAGSPPPAAVPPEGAPAPDGTVPPDGAVPPEGAPLPEGTAPEGTTDVAPEGAPLPEGTAPEGTTDVVPEGGEPAPADGTVPEASPSPQ